MMYKWLLLRHCIITQPHLTLKNLFSNFDIAYLLSEGLCLNCGLKELALNGFDITAHGVIILAKALEHHCTRFKTSACISVIDTSINFANRYYQHLV